MAKEHYLHSEIQREITRMTGRDRIAADEGVQLATLIRKKMKYALIETENTSQGKTLVKNGKWVVAISERPKGWEKLGIAEQE